MPSIQEMQTDMQAAQAHGDVAMAQHIGGLIQQAQHQQNGAIAGEQDFGQAGNAAMAAGIHAVHELPLVGDAGLTAGRWARAALSGQPISWGQANDETRTIVNSAQQQHPIASTLGGVVGGVATAALGGAAVRGVGMAAPAWAELKAGQTAANIGRLALRGGAAGAAQGGAQAGGEQLAGGHVAQAPAAAATGALGGALAGAVVGPAVGGAAGIAARVGASLDSKTALALSRVFDESPADMQAAWSTFKANTNRAPTMAELASLKTAGQIKGAAQDSSIISDSLTQAQNDAAQARSANMQQVFNPQAPVNGGQQVVVGGGPTPAGDSSGEIANATTAQGDVDYSVARHHDFQIPTEESAALGGVSPADHLAAQVVPLAGLKTADRVRIVGGLQNGTLNGQDAQMLRSKLNAVQGTGSNYSPAVSSALGDLDDILQSPGNDAAHAALANANANYVANSQRAAGAMHGESILGSATAPNFAAEVAAKPNDNPNFKPGMIGGAATKLAAASATPQGATQVAQRLATDGNLYQKLNTVFGGQVAAAFQRLGQSESSAAQNLAPYANRVSTDDQDSKDAKVVIQAVAGVASHGIAWKALHAWNAVQGLGMSPIVQEKVAQYLSDPKMTAQGIALLRKGGATGAQIRQLAIGAAQTSAAAGVGAANSVFGQEPQQ